MYTSPMRSRCNSKSVISATVPMVPRPVPGIIRRSTPVPVAHTIIWLRKIRFWLMIKSLLERRTPLGNEVSQAKSDSVLVKFLQAVQAFLKFARSKGSYWQSGKLTVLPGNIQSVVGGPENGVMKPWWQTSLGKAMLCCNPTLCVPK